MEAVTEAIRTMAPQDIPFRTEAVFRLLKIPPAAARTRGWWERVEALRSRALRVISPRYHYRIFPVADIADDAACGVGEVVFRGRGVAVRLRHCHAAAVFLITLGGEIDTAVRALQPEDPEAAYFLDAVASTLLHGALEILRDDLAEYARRSRSRLTQRFSPGYARWPLGEQTQLFHLLEEGRKIGVRLTEGLFMVPQKSLSGIFGLQHFLPSTEGSEACKRPSSMNSPAR